MRLVLNEKAANKIEKLRQEYTTRGLKSEVWMQIVSDAICATPASTWKSLIDKNTPQEVFIMDAMKDPKMQKELADFVRAKMQKSAPISEEAALEI